MWHQQTRGCVFVKDQLSWWRERICKDSALQLSSHAAELVEAGWMGVSIHPGLGLGL